MKTRKELQKKLDKIQKEIDNFKEELEVGKWYKYIGEHIGAIVNYQGGGNGFGVSMEGNWMVHENTDKTYSSWTFESETENWLPATDKEVEKALIKEAKKRGFKEGVYIKSEWLLNKKSNNTLNKGYYFRSNKNELMDGNSIYTLFKDGKWAEIIEDKKPTIDGCEIEVSGENVKFGCLDFKKTYIFRLHKEIELFNTQNENSQITSFIIDSRQTEIEELKEVVDYLNK